MSLQLKKSLHQPAMMMEDLSVGNIAVVEYFKENQQHRLVMCIQTGSAKGVVYLDNFKFSSLHTPCEESRQRVVEILPKGTELIIR